MNWEKYAYYGLVHLSVNRFVNHELNLRGPKVFITDVLKIGARNYKKKQMKPKLAYKIYSFFEKRINDRGVNTFNNAIRTALSMWNIEFIEEKEREPRIVNHFAFLDSIDRSSILAMSMGAFAAQALFANKDGITVRDIFKPEQEKEKEKK